MMTGNKSLWGRGIVLSIVALPSLVFTACGMTTDDIANSGGGVAAAAARCAAATDCPHPNAPCVRAACESGVCVEVLEPAGPSLTILQQPRDCHRLECDGKGGTVNVVDDSDLPSDGEPCTEDTCHAGIPGHANVAGA